MHWIAAPAKAQTTIKGTVVSICERIIEAPIALSNAIAVPFLAPIRSMTAPHLGVAIAAVRDPVISSAPVAEPERPITVSYAHLRAHETDS